MSALDTENGSGGPYPMYFFPYNREKRKLEQQAQCLILIPEGPWACRGRERSRQGVALSTATQHPGHPAGLEGPGAPGRSVRWALQATGRAWERFTVRLLSPPRCPSTVPSSESLVPAQYFRCVPLCSGDTSHWESYLAPTQAFISLFGLIVTCSPYL